MKKNQIDITTVRGGAVLGLVSMTALFIVVCAVALVLNITASQGSFASFPMAQVVSSRESTSIASAPPQTNPTNNNADCLTVVKVTEIFGIQLFNPIARADNNSCRNARMFADVPVAYPPTPSAQFERTTRTIKRGPQAAA